MSILDDNLDIDGNALINLILKCIEHNTFLNEKLSWNIVIDKNNISDYMSTPDRWYLYYTCNMEYNIYLYSDTPRPWGCYVVTNKEHKPINLKQVLYEFTR